MWTRTALTTVVLVLVLTTSLALETTSTTSTWGTATGLAAVVLEVVGGSGLVVGRNLAVLATVLPLPITLGLGHRSMGLLSLRVEAKLLAVLLRRELVRRLDLYWERLLLLSMVLLLSLLGPLRVLHLLLLMRLLGNRLEGRDGPRDRLGVLVHIEALVDGLRNGLNLSTKVALNVIEVESVIPVDQVNSKTKMAIATRATNTMKVCLGILGEIEVDDDVHGLNVDTTSEEI